MRTTITRVKKKVPPANAIPIIPPVLKPSSSPSDGEGFCVDEADVDELSDDVDKARVDAGCGDEVDDEGGVVSSIVVLGGDIVTVCVFRG